MPGVTPRFGHSNARDCLGILVQRLAKPGILASNRGACLNESVH
eukprot:COSAG02_NODE_155_length_33066_cov_32.167562_11_plen_44_part_00